MGLMSDIDLKWHEVEVTIKHSPLLFGTPTTSPRISATRCTWST